MGPDENSGISAPRTAIRWNSNRILLQISDFVPLPVNDEKNGNGKPVDGWLTTANPTVAIKGPGDFDIPPDAAV